MEFPKQATDDDVHKMDNDECNCKMSKEELVFAEDMFLEILLHLPPLSVIRFKCVCKSWYSLISNPCFLRNHARHFHLKLRFDPLVMEIPPGFLLSPDSRCSICSKHSVYALLSQNQDQDENENPPPFFKVFLDHSIHAFEQKNSSYFLVDSCNGLLLYYARNLNSDIPHQYKLFNPITNQCNEIPVMDLLRNFIEPNEDVLMYYPHIVFDPSISFSYKVITVVRGHTHFQFYIYSSETGSWRLLTSLVKKYATARATFMFDGVFYWLGKDASIFYDVVKESVCFLPMPPIPEEYPNRDVLYFGEWGGRLRLMEGKPGCWFPCSFNIMEMEQGSMIWTVKSRVNIGGDCDHIEEIAYPYHLGLVKVMYLYETEKGEEVVLLNVDYQKIISYNITTNTFGKDLTIPYFEHYGCLSAFPFKPTLFPLLT